MHVDDLADGLVYLLRYYNNEMPINIGTGEEISIRNLAEMLQEISGWTGVLKFDPRKPDGSPRKVMDNKRIHKLGWKHRIHFRPGLLSAYKWFAENQGKVRR